MTTFMTLYRTVLVLKFLAVMAYSGGLVAAFVANDTEIRKRSIHTIASPALLCVWIFGYLLVEMAGIHLLELWTASGLVLSFAAHMAAIRAVTRARRDARAVAACFVPLGVTVIVMVLRPTFGGIFS